MARKENRQMLIEQAKAGDRAALERLLLDHCGVLSSDISGRLPTSLQSVISVEDVTQEALLLAYKKIHLLRNTTTDAFVAWLKAIGRSALMGLVKEQRRQKRGGQHRRVEGAGNSATDSLFVLLDQLPDETATASQAIARDEAICALRVCISGLPPDQRRAIHLYVLQGKSLTETAAEMQKTPASVRSLVHRAKRNLSEAMGRASTWLSRK